MQLLVVIKAVFLRTILIQIFLGLCLVTHAEPSVVSPDKLLEVSGGDSATNGRFFSLVKEVREALYKILELEESSQKYVIKVLLTQQGDKSEYPIKKRIIKSPRGWLMTLTVDTRKGVSALYFKQFLCELFLYEIALRNHEKYSNKAVKDFQLPRWLSTGVFESVLWGIDKADTKLYKQAFNLGESYPIDQLLQESSLQGEVLPLGYTFKVSSGALVSALLQQKDGAQNFLKLIQESLLFKGEQKALITSLFPESALLKGSLNEWGKENLLLRGARKGAHLEDMGSSLQKLQGMLQITLHKDNGVEVVIDPKRYIELKSWDRELYIGPITSRINELSLLESKAVQPLRSLIQGYQQVMLRLIDSPLMSISANEFFSVEQLELMSVTEMILRLEEEFIEKQDLKRSLVKHLDTIEFLEYLDLDFDERKAYQAEIIRHQMERSQVRDPLGEYLDHVQKLYNTKAD